MTTMLPGQADQERIAAGSKSPDIVFDVYLRRLSEKAEAAGRLAVRQNVPRNLELGYLRGYSRRLGGPPQPNMDSLHHGWTIAGAPAEEGSKDWHIAGIAGINSSDWRLVAVRITPEDIRPNGIVSAPIESANASEARPYGDLKSKVLYETTSAQWALGTLSLEEVAAGLNRFYDNVSHGQ